MKMNSTNNIISLKNFGAGLISVEHVQCIEQKIDCKEGHLLLLLLYFFILKMLRKLEISKRRLKYAIIYFITMLTENDLISSNYNSR